MYIELTFGPSSDILMVGRVNLRMDLYMQLKRKTQSPCLIKDYRNAELTRSPCVYVDGSRNYMDMMDRTRCLHESITDCNY